MTDESITAAVNALVGSACHPALPIKPGEEYGHIDCTHIPTGRSWVFAFTTQTLAQAECAAMLFRHHIDPRRDTWVVRSLVSVHFEPRVQVEAEERESAAVGA